MGNLSPEAKGRPVLEARATLWQYRNAVAVLGMFALIQESAAEANRSRM